MEFDWEIDTSGLVSIPVIISLRTSPAQSDRGENAQIVPTASSFG